MDKILSLVYSELKNFDDQDPSRIFIGGFSQGGAVSLAVLFRIYKDLSNLGGVISVTGPLPLSKENFLVPKGRLRIPVLMVAGPKDTITDLTKMQIGKQTIQSHYGKNGRKVEFQIDPKNKHDMKNPKLIQNWLKKVTNKRF